MFYLIHFACQSLPVFKMPQIFKESNHFAIKGPKDENGRLVFILPDIHSESLQALSDFIYTGQALFTSEEVKRDLDSLLADRVEVSCSQVGH